MNDCVDDRAARMERVMMYKDTTSTETLSDRLAALDQRIARMRALNATHGDALALRLIGHAETERRALLAQMPPAAKTRP
jgi:hypothetical protein